MPLALTPNEVATITGTTVPPDAITVAALLIDDQTGWSVDEHVDSRLLAAARVRTAWALAAVKVHTRNQAQGESAAVTSETQQDYSYTEDQRLALVARFGQVCDGQVLELLGLARGAWSHV